MHPFTSEHIGEGGRSMCALAEMANILAVESSQANRLTDEPSRANVHAAADTATCADAGRLTSDMRISNGSRPCRQRTCSALSGTDPASVFYAFGCNMYGHFKAGGRDAYLRDGRRINLLIDMLAQSCPHNEAWQWCTPFNALVEGVRQMASGRSVRAAKEPGESTSRIVPGILRFQRPGFAYPLHFDAHLANAWAPLRQWYCDESATVLEGGFDPEYVRNYPVPARHHFSAAAILTLQSPERERNPYDLRIYAARWPSIVRNCSIRTTSVGGINVRLDSSTWPADMPYVDVRGEAGDMYLFNSEHVHITPTIRGDRSRVVVGGIAGYSAGDGPVDVWS